MTNDGDSGHQPARGGTPTLAPHVAVRRHVIGGRGCVALHDLLHERVAIVGVREWTLLRCADGTRDLGGILTAAARRGHYAQREHLESFLDELDGAGMLARDERDAALPPPHGTCSPAETPVAPRAEAPLDPLDGYRLDCDGRGTCCRIYPTILFAPLEAARARVHGPEVLDAGHDEERLFTPDRGSTVRTAAGRLQGQAGLVVEGRCGYLADDLRCQLHLAGGAAAKPMGCRLFPATFTDDGEAIRVSVAPECACVFVSAVAGTEAGTPLVPSDARTGADLPPEAYVRSLVEPVPLTSDESVPRLRYVPWSRLVAGHWTQTVEQLQAATHAPPREPVSGAVPVADSIDALWALARAVEDQGLDEPATGQALRCPPPAPAIELRPWVASLRGLIERRGPHDVSWRAPGDIARRAFDWLREACALIETRDEQLEGASVAAVASPLSTVVVARGRLAEAFYLRALFHGHGILDGLPLASALRDRAVRLTVARALPAAMSAEGRGAHRDAAFEYPLALCEAMVRGHGLHGYAALAAWDLGAELDAP